MILGIGRANDDIGINSMNNLLKSIADIQNGLAEKMIKVSVTEQIEASQEGLGGIIDEYA